MNALEEALSSLDSHGEQSCNCAPGNYCPCHGSFVPSVNDAEILSVLEENTRTRQRGRVIRKKLD